MHAPAVRDWDSERRAWAERVANAPDDPAAHEALGETCWWLNDREACTRAREAAFRLYRSSERDVEAGRVATWLGYASYIWAGDPYGGAGWWARARRLLAPHRPCLEAGWLDFREGEMVLQLERDIERAAVLARSARDIGTELGAIDLEMCGLGLTGLTLVAAGRVAEGMRALDEATAAAIGGEMQMPGAIGNVCCHLVYACERVRDVDRAAHWCDRVREVAARHQLRGLFGVCRAHYAQVLIWRGEWEAAERELDDALEDFRHGAPALTWEATVALAELRRRQGRPAEALAACRPVRWAAEAQLVMASAALDAGDTEAAAEHLERHRAALGQGSVIEHAAGAEVGTALGAAVGDGDTAEREAARLREAAVLAGTLPLRAAACVAAAHAAAARGHHDVARRELEEAADCYSRAGAPWELARVRHQLAQALTHLGRREDASREASTAAAALHALAGTRRRGPLSDRELDVLRLVAGGHSDAEIARQLVLSPHTVHRHVANIRTKLRAPSRAAAIAHAAREGLL